MNKIFFTIVFTLLMFARVVAQRLYIGNRAVLFFMFFLTLYVSGKNINGIVLNLYDNKPIETASVLIKAHEYETRVLSDSTGHFCVNIPTDTDTLSIFVSHTSYISKNITLTSDSSLYIYLIPRENVLDEVVVKSNWIYRRDGDMIVDVSQIPNSENLQANQVLKYIPGVIKSSDGNYLLNGKSASIFINGIKQNISVKSLETFLSSLPSNAISTVELTNINTGKYAASTDAVININTNRNIPLGYSLQPYAFVSSMPDGLNDYGGNVFYMMKMRRVLFHNTLSYTNSNEYGIRNDSLISDATRLFFNHSNRGGRMNIFTYQGSLVYTFSNEHTLNLNAFIYNDFGKPLSSWESVKDMTYEEKRERSDLYNISLAYKIPSSYRRFNGSVAYALSYGGQHSKPYYYNINKDATGTAELDMEGWMNTLSIDFNTDIRRWRFSYGSQIDYNSVWDKMDYRYDDALLNESSKFTGYEFLSAVYGQARYSFNDNLVLRGGIRMENTFYSYRHKSSDDKSSNYLNVFPSLLLYYNTKNYYSSLGFVSNITRPKYESMLPGKRKINDYIYVLGNPNILPTRNYALVFYNTLFQYAQLNFSYVWGRNVIGNVYVMEGNILSKSSDNIADNRSFKTNIVLPFSMLKQKLTGQVQFNASYNHLYSFKNGFVRPTDRSANYWTRSYSAVVNYVPTERCNISIQGSYFPKTSTLIYTENKNMSMDLEMYYSFLKEKNLIVSATISDLFAKDNIRKSHFLDMHSHSTMENIGPTFLISIKLRLNKGQRVVEEYKDYTPGTSRLY